LDEKTKDRVVHSIPTLSYLATSSRMHSYFTFSHETLSTQKEPNKYRVDGFPEDVDIAEFKERLLQCADEYVA
jgi:hypothetical protein